MTNRFAALTLAALIVAPGLALAGERHYDDSAAWRQAPTCLAPSPSRRLFPPCWPLPGRSMCARSWRINPSP